MKVVICMGSRCVMTGAMTIYDQVEALYETIPGLDLEIETVTCLKMCKESEQDCPYVLVDGEVVKRATSQGIMQMIMDANEEVLGERK